MLSSLSRIYLKVVQLPLFSLFPHLQFFLIYLLDDPWSLSSEAETVRFTYGVDYLSQHFNRPSLNIDIGCGVGHNSKLLSIHSSAYIGLDISHSAIKSARRNNPSLSFFQIDNLFELHTIVPPQPGTIVTLFEILYYLPDPHQFLFYLKCHYDNVLVSYFISPSTDLDDLFDPIWLEQNSSVFCYDNKYHRFLHL